MASVSTSVTGIVISTVRYGDNGVVANVLTRDDGRRAYMASATGGKSGKGGRMAMLMPLSLIEFVASGIKRTAMPRMSQTRFRRPLGKIPFDPTRRAVAMFVAELLTRAVPEEVPDPVLFDFVDASISILDDDIDGTYNFHLWFMMHLADHLGIGPERNTTGSNIFDMEAGLWADRLPPHPFSVCGREAELWESLGETDVTDLASITMTRSERQHMIDLMSQYYKIHLPGFGQLKSQTILAMLN